MRGEWFKTSEGTWVHKSAIVVIYAPYGGERQWFSVVLTNGMSFSLSSTDVTYDELVKAVVG